jgi:hypothetical protein
MRKWLIGYIVALFAALPIALPCWNNWLLPSLGRFVTVEQIHLLQYTGLGWLAGLSTQTPLILVGIVGLLEEMVQSFLPQRFFQWSDVGLNWGGGLLGLFAVRVGQNLCRLAEQRMGALKKARDLL